MRNFLCLVRLAFVLLIFPQAGRSQSLAPEAAAGLRPRLAHDSFRPVTVGLKLDPASAEPAKVGTIFVEGEVRNPGPQDIVAGKTLTLTQAIRKAGGLGSWGNGRKVRLKRINNGITETTIVDYSSLVENGDVKNDPALQNGDRIYVVKMGPSF